MRDYTRHRGVIGAALILAVLVAAVLVNMTAVEATAKFGLKVDLTDSRLYELSDITIETAGDITSPVLLTVCSSETDYPQMLREILSRYDGLSPYITVEYRDPYENPVLVESYRQRGISVAENDIIVNGRKNIRQLKLDDLYVFNPSKTRVRSVRAEQALTSALLYATSSEALKVAFSDGHGERASQALMRLFRENNFTVERVALSVSGIAGDTDLVVVAAPERDFQPEETQRLNTYLENGGRMLVFMGPGEKRLENFEALLERWGVSLNKNLICEDKAYVANNPVNIVPMYAPHPVNKFFADKRYFLVSPATRGMERSGWTEFELEVMPVLTSSPGSYACGGGEGDTAQRGENDPSGPFIVGLSSVRDLGGAESGPQARMVVLGSRRIYDDDILGKSTYANSDFLVQVINWLTSRQSSISIPAKNVAPEPINVMPDTIWTIGIVFVGVIPLLLILWGVIICMRRRRL